MSRGNKEMPRCSGGGGPGFINRESDQRAFRKSIIVNLILICHLLKRWSSDFTTGHAAGVSEVSRILGIKRLSSY